MTAPQQHGAGSRGASAPGVPAALDPWRWALEPAAALLVAIVWLVADIALATSGRLGFGSGEQLAVMLFVCGSVALSRIAPEIALGVAVLGGLVAVTGNGSVLVVNGLACFLVLAIAVFGIAMRAGRILRWLTFAACILGGPALATYLQRAHEVAARLKLSGIDVLDVPQLGDGASVLGAALLLSAGLVAAWVGGVLLPGRASRGMEPVPGPETGALGSWNEWLLRPSGAVWSGPGGRGASAGELFGIGDGVDYDGPAVFRRLTPRAALIDLIAGAALLLIGVLGSSGEFTIALVTILLSAGLAVRRMSPVLAVGLCWVAAIIQIAWRTEPIVAVGDLAVLGVLYAMAAYGNRATRRLGLASAFAGAVVAAVYLTTLGVRPDGLVDASNPHLRFALQTGVDFVGLFILFGFCWVLGLLARSRRMARAGVRARLLSEFDRQRAQERVVIEQQRTRIAREVHDVVAHSLAVVIAQADGTRYGHSGEPAIVEESLRTISATARAALGDVRQLLAELRDGDSSGPQPGVEDLGNLIEQLRSAGLVIRFEETGGRLPVSPGTQIALYRIVQEALTNALRHGSMSEPVGLACRWEDEGVEITVVNRLRRRAPPGGADARTGELRIGHGLPGMRERATLAGGLFHASADGDVFLVRAFLPRVAGERPAPGDDGAR